MEYYKIILIYTYIYTIEWLKKKNVLMDHSNYGDDIRLYPSHL